MLWKVTSIHGRADSGRARPPKVELVRQDGETCEGYLKSPLLHGAKSPHCLEREWIATQLAKELHLPCADVVPVKVTPELRLMASTLGIHELDSGPELLLASVSLGPGWSEWTPAVGVSTTQLEQACAIYFFDTMIQNWDRVIPNPNLLIKNDMYGLIDHEESFVEAAGSDAERDETKPPWVDEGVANDAGEYLEHPLWRGIKLRANATFDPIVAKWKSLSEEKFQSYCLDPVFNEWSGHVATKIVDYLVEVTERTDAVHMQIEANRCN